MSTLLEKFDYFRPDSLEQLTSVINDHQENNISFAFSAGGTNLIPHLKTKVYAVSSLVSLNGISDFNGITQDGDKLIIGALTPLIDIIQNDLIAKYMPILAATAHKVASPQIRNRATIGGNIMVDNRCIYINQSTINRDCHSPCFKAGGNICHLVKSAKRGDDVLCQARFVSDTAPVLLLLGTKINVVGPHGARKIALHELYLNDGIENKSLQAGEIITSLEVDIPNHNKFYYEKLAIRNALDFPSLGVAVRLNPNSLCVALTGLNIYPGVFHTKGDKYDTFDDMVSDICDQASTFAVTYQQDFFSRAYRKSMIPVFIRRGIDTLKKKEKV